MLALAIFAMTIGAVAPLVCHWRRKAGSVLLVLGAAILAAIAVTNLVAQDPRAGVAAIEANRRFDFIIAGCELPAFVLALISLKRLTKLYWVSWGIHLALTIYLAIVIVWLEFFWHW